MSMYADYVNERGVKRIEETQNGFATYLITGQECYIEDIYVRPEARKSHVASALADSIAEKAKLQGCRYLTGSVVPTANGSTDSCIVLLSYGFKLLRSESNVIWFVKEIR